MLVPAAVWIAVVDHAYFSSAFLLPPQKPVMLDAACGSWDWGNPPAGNATRDADLAPPLPYPSLWTVAMAAAQSEALCMLPRRLACRQAGTTH